MFPLIFAAKWGMMLPELQHGMKMMPDSMMEDEYDAPPPTPWRRRLGGGGLVLAALLLLACLLSYHPQEVSWSFLNPAGHEQAAGIPCSNWLGVLGMYLAGLLYKLLGAGAVYGALLLLVPGVGMLLHPEAARRNQVVAMLVMLLVACALLAVQPWLLLRWAAELSLASAGGALGYWVGVCVVEAILGAVWALCGLLLAHAVGMIYFARLTPAEIYRVEKRDVVDLWSRWMERRRRAREGGDAADYDWQKSFPDEAGAGRPPAEEEPELMLYGEPDLQPAGRVAAPQQESPMSWRDDYTRRETPRPSDERVERPREAPAAPPRYAAPVRPAPVAPRPQPQPRPVPAPAPEPEPAEPQPARRPEPPHEPRRQARRGTADNLLDLLQPVEDEIERRNTYGVDEDAPYIPINAHTAQAISRHFGTPEPAAPRPQPVVPRPQPQPRPVPAPAPEPEPAEPQPVRRPEPALFVEDEGDYPLPPYELLNYEPPSQALREAAEEEMLQTQATIADTLESFRISVQPGEITRGPSITRYEFAMLRGQSVKTVANKKNDLMAATRSASVNILAPIPGKSTVGIELQNSVMEPVYLRELLQSEEFHNPKMRLPVALGKNVYGKPVIGDLAAMPHVLVAGTTGSGKSVCINSMLISLLYKFRPDQLKLVLVDPKQVEMQPYKKLPHLAVPVVTDPARVIGALRWAVNEMEHRYKLFSKMGVRNLEDFNKLPPGAQPVADDEDELPAGAYPEDDMSDADAIVRAVEGSQGIERIAEEEDEQGELDFHANEAIPSFLPYIVIVVDELADLMLQVKEDLENYIGRLTQKARAAGIHMVVATQTPRSQVVTGTIKTNLPCRIALKVSSQLDSRVILDEGGAENLLGKGDLLFLPPGGPSKMTRAQGAFVSDEEIASIIKFCASHAKQCFVQSATEALSDDSSSQASGGGRGARGGYGSGAAGDMSGMDEELYTRCVNLVITERKASTTLLQRRFRIGYAKAAEIMELMEKRGVVAPSTGSSRPREVLIEAMED